MNDDFELEKTEDPHPKVLITGGAGYIGSHAVKYFLEKSYEVIVFDNLTTGFRDSIEVLQPLGRVQFYEGDLTNTDDLTNLFSKESNIEGVIHFAAKLSVNESMKQPDKYFRNNVVGTLNLLDKMLENKIDTFVFSSTCAVYGESQYLPVDENHPCNPTNPYGESKALVERMVKWYGQAFGLKYAILRYFNICGASEDGVIGDAKKPSVHLMQNAVKGALGLDKFNLTYSKVKTPDGSPIRDYIDVNDLIEAHFEAYKYLKSGGESDVFNLGTGKGNSVEEIVKKVEEALNVTIPREFGEERQGEYAAVYANYDKAKNKLGWEPKRSLEDSINSLLKWYREHPNGFEK